MANYEANRTNQFVVSNFQGVQTSPQIGENNSGHDRQTLHSNSRKVKDVGSTEKSLSRRQTFVRTLFRITPKYLSGITRWCGSF